MNTQLVDSLPIDLILPTKEDFTFPMTYSSLVGYFNVTLSFRVRCIENYYGPNCTVFCDASVAVGNFVCGSNGVMVCEANYYGSSCDKLCDASTHVGSLNCNSNGELVCLQNYYGSNCTTFCNPVAEDGNYECSSTGELVCQRGYLDLSSNCTQCVLADNCCES